MIERAAFSANNTARASVALRVAAAKAAFSQLPPHERVGLRLRFADDRAEQPIIFRRDGTLLSDGRVAQCQERVGASRKAAAVAKVEAAKQPVAERYQRLAEAKARIERIKREAIREVFGEG